MTILAEEQISLARVDDGQDGTDGTDGVSVTSVTPQYYLSTSSSSATGGSWSDTPQEFVSGKFYWTRDHITYSDNTDDYSTAVYNRGMTKACQDAYDANTQATNTAQYFWFNSTASGGEGAGAHITQIPQSDFVADPDNGGGNTLIDSGGMKVRNGVNVMADFSGEDIALYTNEGVEAFKASASGVSSTQTAYAYNNDAVLFYDVNEPVTKVFEGLETATSGTTVDILWMDSSQYDSDFAQYTATFTKGTASTVTKTISSSIVFSKTYTIYYDGNNEFTYTLTAYTTMGDPHYPVRIFSYSARYTKTAYTPQTTIAGYNVWSDPSKVFVVERYTPINGVSVASKNYKDYSDTISKQGYYPVGVVGHSGHSRYTVPTRALLEDQTIGSATLKAMVANLESSSKTMTLDVDVLWVKAV